MQGLLWFFLSLLFLQTPVFAGPSLEMQVNELAQMVQELRQTVQLQQKEINLLKEAQVISVPPAVSVGPLTGTPSSATKGKWNPDIGVIADTLFKHDTSRSDEEGADRFSVRELELVMGSYVDPYSRMDVNIAFSDFEDVHIQEAYLTRFGLPWETTARVGRFKPKFGKALLYHRDILDTADEPLVIQRYFGQDGLNKTGVDFTKPVDLPFDSSHEVSVGVLEGGAGEGGTVFGETRRRPTIYSHFKSFWDISEITNYELGLSHMMGSSDRDSGFETNVLGLDSTWIHLLGPDQRLKWQSEFFFANQQENPVQENVFGAYSLVDYRFHRRWSAGTRFDFAELLTDEDNDFGYTVYLTFFQTEFARWRLQYNYIDAANGKDDNQFFVQGIFAIGEHKHKLT